MSQNGDFLKVNRDLLDPNFDGYKLSLDNLAKYSVSLASGLDVVPLREDQYTLMHMRSYGMTNHLVLDAWNPSCSFYIDERWNIKQMRVVLESQLDSPQTVFTIPNKEEQMNKTRVNGSFGFPSKDLCILSDGAGQLYLLETGERDNSDKAMWQVLYKEEVCGPGVAFVLLHTTAHQEGPDVIVDCLLLHIEDISDEKENKTTDTDEPGSSFCALLEWVTFSKEQDSTTVKLHRHRTLKAKSSPLYAALGESGSALYIAAEASFEFIADSLKSLKKEEAESKEEKMEDEKDEADESNKKKPAYTWTQTSEDITAFFVVPEGTQKPDIQFTITKTRLDLGVKNGETLLMGPFFRDIDTQLTTWILDGRKLEVCFAKMDEEMMMWSELIVGDTTGEYSVDPDQARIIHERLAHLTSEDMPENSGGTSTCPSDMEDCDAYPEVSTSMMRIDGEAHKITHTVSIGTNQYLFTSGLDPAKPPCICLRHDVDGVLWQPGMIDESSSPWKHEATFNALGYVQASKRDCKFGSCASDISYAVLCDCVRHLYIYRQPEALSTSVRNRKSGLKLAKVAKQQLVSLDCQDNIEGMQVTNERIYVLTKKRFYVLRTKNCLMNGT